MWWRWGRGEEGVGGVLGIRMVIRTELKWDRRLGWVGLGGMEDVMVWHGTGMAQHGAWMECRRFHLLLFLLFFFYCLLVFC